HFVAAKRVRAVLLDHIIRVDNVTARLRHFLIVFAENDSLIDQALKWLRFRNVAEIEEHFMPETRVEQMQHGMFGSAHVKIDTARFAAAYPIFLGLLADEPFVIVRVAKAQVIPTRAGLLRNHYSFVQG